MSLPRCGLGLLAPYLSLPQSNPKQMSCIRLNMLKRVVAIPCDVQDCIFMFLMFCMLLHLQFSEPFVLLGSISMQNVVFQFFSCLLE
uniref:Uncharacterized protein n=1 Tax=Arundo donax TaxID=35708 RepID=A0A0A8ZLS2_ARUDO